MLFNIILKQLFMNDQINWKNGYYDLLQRKKMIELVEIVGRSVISNNKVIKSKDVKLNNQTDYLYDEKEKLIKAFDNIKLPIVLFDQRRIRENRDQNGNIASSKEREFQMMIPYTYHRTRQPMPIICELTVASEINNDNDAFVNSSWNCYGASIDENELSTSISDLRNVLLLKMNDADICSFSDGYKSSFVYGCQKKLHG